jgi:hypothetical protein
MKSKTNLIRFPEPSSFEVGRFSPLSNRSSRGNEAQFLNDHALALFFAKAAPRSYACEGVVGTSKYTQ